MKNSVTYFGKSLFVGVVIFAITTLFFAACSNDSDSGISVEYPMTFTTTAVPEMIRVETGNDTIVVGEGVQSSTEKQTVAPFEMSKYEVSYNLWRSVYNWATSSARGANKYTFQNPGSEGSYAYYTTATSTSYSQCVRVYFNEGNEPVDVGVPVTGINWRDAMVWCNAISEMLGLTPVYYSDVAYTKPYRNSILQTSTSVLPNSYFPYDKGDALLGDEASSAQGGLDNPYVNENANGYRLPYVREWEYAARKMNDGTFIGGGNAPGDASAPATGDYLGTTKAYYYGWSSGQNTTNKGLIQSSSGDGPNPSAAGWNDASGALDSAAGSYYRMHKQGGMLPSGLGFYDMAGNAMEWTFDMGKNTPFNKCYCYAHIMKSSGYYETWNKNFQIARWNWIPSCAKIGGLRLARSSV